MDIRPTGNTDPLSRLGTSGTRKSSTPAGTDRTDFSDTTAIREALDELPDSRSEVVGVGKTLVSQPEYPPAETIKRISTLLAIKIQENQA
jgi:hypothetical protein